MTDHPKPVVFTDLDGTLLDAGTYSHEKAKPALAYLKGRAVPLVMCSSKTRTEIAYYSQRLENPHPFISENGGGIFMPPGYFTLSQIKRAGVEPEDVEKWQMVRLGAPYADLRKALEALRKKGCRVRGFGDMSAEEVAALTGLSAVEAARAKLRDFDEPFVLERDDASQLQAVVQGIRDQGFQWTRGRFFHILGNSDKGKAVRILTSLYKERFGEVVTVALGDSPNDIPMLRAVDHPVVVQHPDGSYDGDVCRCLVGDGRLIKAAGVGPEGWNRAVLSLPFL